MYNHNQTSLLQRLEYKFGRFAIRNLMMIIVGAMGIVFISDFMLPISISGAFAFHREAILAGQVWRIITFIFMPPAASPIFIVFALYLYWMMGSALENEWGAFRFNIFYLCGMIGTIGAGLLTGFATNSYLNLSLFLAFAILYPNFEIRLFFVLPVKMKWLAYFNAAFLVYSFIVVETWSERLALIVSVLNIILFFWKDFMNIINRMRAKAKWNNNFRR
jgi:hypothetical protein